MTRYRDEDISEEIAAFDRAADIVSKSYEYAGFLYSIPDFVPLPGQHYAAYKDKHRKAAREQYMQGLTDQLKKAGKIR